jgi:voltage-gated potassium channel
MRGFEGTKRSARSARLAIFALVSPTWALARWLKSRHDKEGKAKWINRLNWIYLVVSVLAVGVIFWLTGNDVTGLQQVRWNPSIILWAWFLWSRSVEIFVAFYRDAFDKLRFDEPASALTWPQRVRLALNSYAELILNFSLAYGLMPADLWMPQSKPTTMADVLSYSATTITTSGGGGLVPKSWILQLCSSYEIFCGLILLVVCFTIYTSRALAESAKPDSCSTDAESEA